MNQIEDASVIRGKSVYARFRRKMIWATLERATAIGFVSLLIVLIAPPSNNVLAGFFLAGIVIYGVWRTITDQLRLPVAVEGIVLDKHIRSRFSCHLKLGVIRAAEVSADGAQTSVADWLGERTVQVTLDVYKSANRQDKIGLVCFRSGLAIDKLEQSL